MSAMMSGPETPVTPEPGMDDGEQDGSQTQQPGPPSTQPAARFDGIKLRLRQSSAGRYVLGVDVELEIPEGLEGPEGVDAQASDGAVEGPPADDGMQASGDGDPGEQDDP